MECDYPKLEIRSIGTGIDVGSENWSKLGNDTGVNIDSKMKLNHKVGDWGHIHIQVQSHWMKNLPICLRFEIDQVQVCVMRLNLGQSL